nr:MAG TPA: hypothetical protein [Caudoviricetes sp.]
MTTRRSGRFDLYKMCVGWCQISCECKGFPILLGTSPKPLDVQH